MKQRLYRLIQDPANISTSFRAGWGPKTQTPRVTFVQIPKRSFSWSRHTLQHSVKHNAAVTKSLASGSVIFFDIGTTSVASSPIAPYVTTAEKTLYTAASLPRPSICSLTRKSWRRDIHSNTRRRGRGSARRNQSSKANESSIRKPIPNENLSTKVPPIGKEIEPVRPNPDPPSTGYLHLPHMPKLPHRPTKEELLAAATGFWSRLKVRFKWFSIRSARPWNIDDWSAFVSWFVLGNIVWVLVGTTTFFSLVILSINTVVAQGKSSHADVFCHH